MNETQRLAKITGFLIMRVILPIVIIVVAVLGARYLIFTRPKAERARPEPKVAVVRTGNVELANETVTVSGMGTVIAAREVGISSEVGGRVIERNPRLEPGGRLATGDLLLRIDPRDYEYAVTQAEAQVAQAELALRVEGGQRSVAEREWKLLEGQVPTSEAGRELALRKPHLRNAKAALEAAKQHLAQAKLNLERTQLRAPFNAIVRADNVDVGQLISPQTPVATLVGTDRYWVRMSIAVDQLAWFDWPDANGEGGANAVITHVLDEGQTIQRQGRLVRVLSDLESAGRMARVLVAIDNPLGDGGALPLLLGSFVRVDIEGRSLENVARIPRDALHEDNQVWLMNDERKLEIRPVQVAWRGREHALIGDGLRPGEQLVLTRIRLPIEGMPLRLEDETDGATPAVRPEDGDSGDTMAAQGGEAGS